MNPVDATRLVARLNAAYPRMTLDEPEMAMLLEQVTLLADPLILNQAIDRIIRVSERFPSIAEIRAQYRACNEAATVRLPEISEARSDIPEWIQVWFWQQQATRTERQVARDGTRQKVEDRPPVPMRDFPQYEHPGPHAYTNAEYDQIRASWIEAGSPSISAVTEILASI